MNRSEKLCLKWNDFQDTSRSSFGALRNDKDFTDVTLVCEDGEQFEAHKVILASLSPFFDELLKKNRHEHPLIYMRKVKSSDLKAVVDFLYFGEASVFQDDLESFLAIAEDLKLRGLTESNEDNGKPFITPKKEKIVTQQKKKVENESFNSWKGAEDIGVNHSNTESSNFESDADIFSSTSVALNAIGEQLHGLDDQINSMMEFSENMITAGRQKVRARICKVCGKEGHPTDIKRHIEAKHIEGLMFSCDVCGKESRSRNGLQQHKNHNHNYERK